MEKTEGEDKMSVRAEDLTDKQTHHLELGEDAGDLGM